MPQLGEATKRDGILAAAQFIPQISIVALLLVALFNIGYFWKIGIHFLGLMDFSNLVYSLSIVFAILILVMVLIPTFLMFDVKSAAVREGALQKFYRIAIKIFLVPMIALPIVAIMLDLKIVPSWLAFGLSADNLFLIMGVFMLLMTGWPALINFYSGVYDGLTIILSTLAIIVITFQSGASISEPIVSGRTRQYEFQIKNSYEILTGGVLRSSSSGFLIVAQKQIIFLPKEEIRRVSTMIYP